jgi:hypothetical protein
MFRRLMKSAFFLFLFPVVLSMVLFAVLDPGCRKDKRAFSGGLKILYSTDVGGAIDPCG